MTSDSAIKSESSPSSPTETEGPGLRSAPNVGTDLKPGGFVAKHLESSQHNATKSSNALYQQLLDDLKRMNAAYCNPGYVLRIGPLMDITPAEVLRRLVYIQNQQYQANPVLRLSLGNRWQVKDESLDEELFYSAYDAYRKRVEDYDSILGNLIPSNLRRVGHEYAAEMRFEEGTNLTAADDWPIYRRRLEHRQGQPLMGVSTGISKLDVALRGLRGLAFLGGSPGVGKSTLALSIAVHALRADPGLSVLYYSLDMPKTVLYDRLLSQEANVEYRDMLAETSAEVCVDRLEKAHGQLCSQVLPRMRVMERITIHDKETLSQIIADDVQHLYQSIEANKALIIVDYFQLLPVPDGLSPGIDADFHRVEALQSVQEWSKTNGNPAGDTILAITEIRKGESGRTELGVADLMGSARLGYCAESILLLETPKDAVEGPIVPLLLKVAKARDGAIRSQIPLLFEHTRSRFKEAPLPASKKKGGKAKLAGTSAKPSGTVADPLAGMQD